MGALVRHRWRLVLLVPVFVVKDSALWLLPVVTGRAIDVVVAGGPAADLLRLGLLGAVLLLQVYPLHVVMTRLLMGATRSFGATLRTVLTVRLQTMSVAYYGRTSAAVMQAKVVRDVENVELMFAQTGNAIGSAVVVLLGAVVMTALSVPAFLPVFAVAVPVAVGVWWASRREALARNADLRRRTEQLARRVEDMAQLVLLTRAHGVERTAVDAVAADAEAVRRAGYRLDVVNGRFGATSWVLMQVLAVGCLIAAGAASVLGWLDITAGQVVLVSTYFTTLTGTVMAVLSLVPLLTRGAEAVRSLTELLDDPEVEQDGSAGGTAVHHVRGHLRTEHLTVRHAGATEDAVRSVSVDVPAGTTLALVGSSGSGKSTLVSALLGLVRPTGGRVLLDGADLRDLDLRSVRRHVAVVPQESVLFDASIRDNVMYGLAPDEDRLTEALRQAHVLEVVASLPHGVDTHVGPHGSRLSGGQRQRLSIARALARDPRVLVLDEATSALDLDSEREVQAALAGAAHGRTTVVVAHRLSTVTSADLILVLEKGEVLERGTHAELLALGGRYARLWELQGTA